VGISGRTFARKKAGRFHDGASKDKRMRHCPRIVVIGVRVGRSRKQGPEKGAGTVSKCVREMLHPVRGWRIGRPQAGPRQLSPHLGGGPAHRRIVPARGALHSA